MVIVKFFALHTSAKNNRKRKIWCQNGKLVYRLMNNTAYGKPINLTNGINVKLENNQKDYLKWT